MCFELNIIQRKTFVNADHCCDHYFYFYYYYLYFVLFCRRFVGAFIDHPKPLIGMINGPAVGISVTTLGLFDLVYASDHVSCHKEKVVPVCHCIHHNVIYKK